MAATLVQAEFTYRSGTPNDQYTFTIVQNSTGVIAVRDIQNAYGFIISPYSQIPQSVADDIVAAMAQVEAILAATSAINGTLTFASETSKTFTFVTPLANTSYRVQLSPSEFVPLRISAKTTTSFTVQAGAAFSGTVGFDVFV
jgi:hypothetical protein